MEPNRIVAVGNCCLLQKGTVEGARTTSAAVADDCPNDCVTISPCMQPTCVHAVHAAAAAPVTASNVRDVGLKDAPLPSLFPAEPGPPAPVSDCDSHATHSIHHTTTTHCIAAMYNSGAPLAAVVGIDRTLPTISGSVVVLHSHIQACSTRMAVAHRETQKHFSLPHSMV